MAAGKVFFDFGRTAEGDYFAAFDDTNGIAVFGFFQVMGGEKNCRAV